MPDPLDVFAANLKSARVAAGLTQEQLSARSGIDLASVGRIERALRDPGVRTVARLAHGLGIEPSDLWDEVPAQGPGTAGDDA